MRARPAARRARHAIHARGLPSGAGDAFVDAVDSLDEFAVTLRPALSQLLIAQPAVCRVRRRISMYTRRAAMPTSSILNIVPATVTQRARPETNCGASAALCSPTPGAATVPGSRR